MSMRSWELLDTDCLEVWVVREPAVSPVSGQIVGWHMVGCKTVKNNSVSAGEGGCTGCSVGLTLRVYMVDQC